jgi:hypothetical protein
MHRRFKTAALVIAVLAALVPQAAMAQEDPYPGPTDPGPSQPSRDVEQYGPYGPGDSFTVESCGFGNGSVATKTFNDEASGQTTSDGAGCVRTRVQLVERSAEVAAKAAGGPCDVDALVDDARHRAKLGRNELLVLGTGTNGAGREVSNDIVVQCDPPHSGANAAGGSGGVAGQTALGSVAGGEAASSSLPRTGVAIARWAAVGFLLLAFGMLAMAYERRHLARRVAD